MWTAVYHFYMLQVLLLIKESDYVVSDLKVPDQSKLVFQGFFDFFVL